MPGGKACVIVPNIYSTISGAEFQPAIQKFTGSLIIPVSTGQLSHDDQSTKYVSTQPGMPSRECNGRPSRGTSQWDAQTDRKVWCTGHRRKAAAVIDIHGRHVPPLLAVFALGDTSNHWIHRRSRNDGTAIESFGESWKLEESQTRTVVIARCPAVTRVLASLFQSHY
ncbi:hypothetical protein JB92DRAFT_2834164 [Gautieria morchelliformis]|nr:hypothetical protein JB92DRAFT_2834164 [Gautieria morchelliformis]